MVSSQGLEPTSNDTEIVKIVDYWNRDNPRSLINLVSPEVGEYFIKAYEARPELFGIDESSLWKTLRYESKTPSATDNRLRLSFWQEYDHAQNYGHKMRLTAVCAGICLPQYLYNSYMKSPERMAWWACVPTKYEKLLEEGLQYGINQLREILEEPNHDDNGRINTKLIDTKLKIVAMFELRLKGAVTQRIEQRNMNVNVQTTDKQIHRMMSDLSMEEIQKRLNDLEKRDRLKISHEVQNELSGSPENRQNHSPSIEPEID